ncbi:hypothetical protein BC332_08116 [Capsicum chinense]|nr:hypothetical protein BC332_08116 [Capsicum chinense]
MTPQTPQISRYPSLSSLDNIFGSYQPQHFENAPNFTSSPVPMSIDIPDATNNLKNLNTEMEDNELDDANNEVNDNDLEDESKGCDTTIQHDELSKKEKRLWLLIWVALSIGLSVPQGRPSVLTWIALAFCILLVAVRAYLESRAVVAVEVAVAEGQELPDVSKHPSEP